MDYPRMQRIHIPYLHQVPLSSHLCFLVTLWSAQKHTTLHLLSLHPYLISFLFFSLAALESQFQIQF